MLRRAPAGDVEGLGQGEVPVVEGLSDDRALDAEGDEGAQHLEVVKAGDAAGGHDGLAGLFHHLAQQFDVGALQGAVLGHVGHDVAGAAGLLQPAQDLPEVAAFLGPAAAGQRGAADVQSDGDLVAEALDHAGRPLRVLQGGGAEVDPRHTEVEGLLERFVVAQAAGELHLDVEPSHDLAEQLGVGAPAERSIEVHEVDPFRPLPLPVEGGLQRRAVACFAAGLALYQAHCLAVDDVDGGQQLKHGQRGFGGHRGSSASFGGADERWRDC